MAFEIKLYSEDRVTYVPDFRDNRDRAEEWDGEGDRPFFWVELLPLSGRDLNKASSRAFAKAKRDSDFIKGADRLVRRIIDEYVPAAGGLRLETAPGSFLSPASGKEVLDAVRDGCAALGDVVDDIFEALKDNAKAEAGDLKKLRRRSDSSARRRTSAPLPEIGSVPAAPTKPTTTMTPRESRATATD